MRWPMPCRSRKNLMRTESRMDIEEIVKMKLERIEEEEETSREGNGTMIKLRTESSKVRKSDSVVKIGKAFGSKRRFKDSYVIFMNGFASKGGLGGIPRY
ncbi:hypothetical protein SASPL_120283 [Salvia splendens]|uniref:Uncharacterized protein n=1 Tax=Salvia splendens TaxID=180675 RepID=A0A8X8XS69_SALSN|nr:hypothetical protein SASPL_120283 [Salvia splendens]